MIRLLYAGTVSACFERVGDSPYYAPAPFTVFLDEAEQFRCETNVFSLFSLRPGTAYNLRIVDPNGDEERFPFTTAPEQYAFDVRVFGAKGDGVTDDTVAIRTAIRVLPDGARLVFPAGTYCTRPIALKSHLTVELQRGATLLGSTERERYPVLPAEVENLNGGEPYLFGTFEGLPRPMYQALLSAQNAEDIAIVGEGVVDGNAQNSDFWTAGRNLEIARPRLVSLLHCKDVVLHGFTAQNSPSWNFHPFQ